MKFLLEDGKTEIEVIENRDAMLGETFSVGPSVIITLAEALQPISLFCAEALGRLRSVSNPNELEIEFGLEAGGEGGIFGLAKASSKATIKLTARWKA